MFNSLDDLHDFLDDIPFNSSLWENYPDKKSKCRKLHGLMLLSDLFPNKEYIIDGAGRDELWINVSEEEALSLSKDQWLELDMCAISFVDDSMVMYV